jgi:hypothetical protein
VWLIQVFHCFVCCLLAHVFLLSFLQSKTPYRRRCCFLVSPASEWARDASHLTIYRLSLLQPSPTYCSSFTRNCCWPCLMSPAASCNKCKALPASKWPVVSHPVMLSVRCLSIQRIDCAMKAELGVPRSVRWRSVSQAVALGCARLVCQRNGDVEPPHCTVYYVATRHDTTHS